MREGFNVKAVTWVMATPDEISNALTDPVQRPQWDSSISAISKQSPESIQITYKGIDGLSTHTENIKVDFFMDKASVAGSHFIQEYVNGEFYRLYELQTVQNRPQQLRVTLYTKVTPAAFNVREKDIFRSLNSMRNFISQSNRAGQTPMVLRKNEENDNEMFACLKATGFELIPEDDESVIEDDLSDALNAEPKAEGPAPVHKIEFLKSWSPQTSIPPPVSGNELIAQLGEFKNNKEVLETPMKEVFCIKDWDSLFSRYKPENIRKPFFCHVLISLIQNSISEASN